MKGLNKIFGVRNSENRWVVDKKSIRLDRGFVLKNHIHPHSLPDVSTPNSQIEQRDDNGKIVRIRHYDENGFVKVDVDYTDHGTPEIHKVPHTHEFVIIDGRIHRKKGE